MKYLYLFLLITGSILNLNAQLVKKNLGNHELSGTSHSYGPNFVHYKDNVFFVGHESGVGNYNVYVFEKNTESVKKITSFTNLNITSELASLTVVGDFLYFIYDARILYRVNISNYSVSPIGTFCTTCNAYSTIVPPKTVVLNDTIYVFGKNNSDIQKAYYTTNSTSNLVSLALPFSIYDSKSFVVFNRKIATATYVNDTAAIAIFNAKTYQVRGLVSNNSKLLTYDIYRLTPLLDKLVIEAKMSGNADSIKVWKLDKNYATSYVLSYKNGSSYPLQTDSYYYTGEIYYSMGSNFLLMNLLNGNISLIGTEAMASTDYRLVNKTIVSYSTTDDDIYFYEIETKKMTKHTLNAGGYNLYAMGMTYGTRNGNRLYFNAKADNNGGKDYLMVTEGTPESTRNISTNSDFYNISTNNYLYSNSNYVLANATGTAPNYSSGLYVIYDKALGLEWERLDNTKAYAFPNPSNNTFSILNLPDIDKIEVLDINGQSQYKGPPNMFGENLNAGLYFCKFTKAGKTHYLRLIKQ